jgi:NAD(P)H-hydrate epimerase
MRGRIVPAITTDEMREVDRAMVEDYGIELMQMMENAGRNLALLTSSILGGEPRGKTVLVLAGRGNNGGGGLVAARHLTNFGVRATVLLTAPTEELSGIPALQAGILQKTGIELHAAGDASSGDMGALFSKADIILDALIGYGLTGDPREPIASLIRRSNASGKPVVSLDTPSGLDTTTGEAHDPTISAAATLTLALPKTGLGGPQARAVVGRLYLADISIPQPLYRRFGIDKWPLFPPTGLVELTFEAGEWYVAGE